MRKRITSKIIEMDSGVAIQRLKDAVVADNICSMLKKEQLAKKTDFKGLIDLKKKTFQITLRATKGSFFYKALKGRIEDTSDGRSEITYSLGYPKETIVVQSVFVLLFLLIVLLVPATSFLKVVLLVLLGISVSLNHVMTKFILRKCEDDGRLISFVNEIFKNYSIPNRGQE